MAITKTDLAARVNNKLNLRDKELVNLIVGETFEQIEECLMESQEVITHVGTFTTYLKHNSTNPKTGEKLNPMWLPKFKFSMGLRRRIKAKRADYYGMKINGTEHERD